MATMARAGQLIGDYMATNNALNQRQPVPKWFLYLNTTLTDITGDFNSYSIVYDTTLYASEGVTVVSDNVTVPISGYYLLTAGTKVSGITASHTRVTLNIGGVRYYGNNPDVIDVGTSYSITCNAILYIASGSSCNVEISFVSGPKVIDIIGAAAPNYVTWFSGQLLHT